MFKEKDYKNEKGDIVVVSGGAKLMSYTSDSKVIGGIAKI